MKLRRPTPQMPKIGRDKLRQFINVKKKRTSIGQGMMMNRKISEKKRQALNAVKRAMK
jgi:hypothetical protein